MANTKVPVELSSTPSIVDNGDATAITISSNENVLIGSSTEIGTLIGCQITGTNNPALISLFRDDSSVVANDDLGAILFFGDDNNATTQLAYIRATAEGTHADGDNPTALRFATTADGSESVTERMRIDSSGNVGVATSTPANLLHIKASSDGAGLTIQRSSTTAGTYGQLSFINTTTDNYSPTGWIRSYRNSGGVNVGEMTFGTAGTERMRIDGSGNFLLGTTDTSYSSGPGFKFTPSATNPINGMVVNTSTGNASNFHFYNMNASYSGFRWYIHANGGTINYAGNNVNLSDEKVKTNIELSGNYLEKICNIPVKLFNYKDEPEDKDRSLGVIAQDVEAFAPELVNNDGFGETPEDGVPLKTVYTTDMMYALMKAIQEQQVIIEDLQQQINEVKNGN